MKRLFFLAILMIATLSVGAQRKTDVLDRGLVAIKTTEGVYCSWRILAEEYYDVTYNLYRDGVKIAEGLSVSNYTDAAGADGSKYTVKAVVRGAEQEASKEVTPWAQKYLEITPDHGALTSTYVPNDACCADVDGDGELEILLKFDNLSEIQASYPKEGYNGEYSIVEVYKLNGKKLWWLDFGPNMGDFQNNEQNIVAYDWDEDGKAEAVIRAADGTTIHLADGTTQVIGDATKNYRSATGGGTNWFMHEGAEYLVYMNGETGKPYQVMEYPLKRLEDGETDLNAAWGDGYGHRSTKHFFGAPVLDGRKASIFLARGIYTRHKMIALDVNTATHELTVRWRWNNNTPGSPWYGQGYHNYSVADVDWDGRDEICFGSMVIDDNGHGLSTTGLGHGDAHHVGDFNPYIHGQEFFACNEDRPGNNYRDATTSKIYYRYEAGDDDGRAMMGNFTDDFPGCQGISSRDPNLISSVINGPLPVAKPSDVTQNFRIYWDGDLCDETQDYSSGKNTAIAIYKYGKGKIETLTGSLTNNDTKGTPCYQGDLFGDWREEIIARTADNKIRIYTTTMPTEWRIPTLWHDHQYRQAMVWQMCGYNQPPHVSYFLGEVEGITQAPPALTMTGRKEIANGGNFTTTDNAVITCEPNDMTVSVSDGASPYIFFDNTPSWVQGHDSNDNIDYTYYTHTLTGGAFAGDMRLVKQGDGILVLPNVVEKYTGRTEVWGGTLRFNGTLENSSLWLNRHTALESDGGQFKGGITADYNATIAIGTTEKAGNVTVSDLTLGFGSRVVFDVFADSTTDQLKVTKLHIGKKDWQNGPQYDAPVIQIVTHNADGTTTLAAGSYELMTVGEVEGDVSDIIIEGIAGQKYSLTNDGGKLSLNVAALRDPADVVWDGGTDGIWDLANAENFVLDGNKDFFVSGDNVTFNDAATNTAINIVGEVKPASVTFDNSEKNFTVDGEGSIIGDGSLTKKGSGSVTINNVNKYTGGTTIEDGKLIVGSLANSDGAEFGALGGVDNTIMLNGGTLAVSQTMVTSQPVSIGDGNGMVEVAAGKQLTLNAAISGSKKELTKAGNGTLVANGAPSYGTLVVNAGVVQAGERNAVHTYPSKIVLNDGTLKDPNDIYSYSTNNANVEVPEGSTATWTLDSRCDYKGKLTGSGQLTVNVTSVRCNMQGDWSQFEGILKFQNTKTGSYEPSLQWNNSYGLGKATVIGNFFNDGKDVTIGTLTDKSFISGGGKTTVKHIALDIRKIKGTITNSYFEVEHLMVISGPIDITLNGTLKAGDRITLWKVGALQDNGAVVNLPELPEGLYWDTTNLLKAEGVLKVTNEPVTGIVPIHNSQFTIDNEAGWFTLDGRKLQGKPTQKGVYIMNGKQVVIK